MTNNAYFIDKILKTLANNSHRWVWSKEEGWEKTKIKEEDKNKILRVAHKTFDTYPSVTVVC